MMKIIITSAILASAGSLVVNAKESQNKIVIPMILEKDEPQEPSDNNFIVVPNTDCKIDKSLSFDQIIKLCTSTDKTWLKAI